MCSCILNFSKQIGHTQSAMLSLFFDYSSISTQSSCERGFGGEGTNPNFYAKLNLWGLFNLGSVRNYLEIWSCKAAALM